MKKKGFVVGLIFTLLLVLTACGEPELSIDGKPKNSYMLVYDGTTDKQAKVTVSDESKEKEKVEVDAKGNFTLSIPRLTSSQTYVVKSSMDDKTTTQKLEVKGAKKLIDFNKLRDQFNYISQTEDELSIEIPESVESRENFVPGFALSTDGPNVMAIYLSQGTSGIETSSEFSYAIAAVAISLEANNDLSKILDAYAKSVKENATARATVNNVVYEFVTVEDIITSLMIYPK